MNCPHLDDIAYGKAITVSVDTQIVHMLCTTCKSVGTVLEKRTLSDPEHWEPIEEIWHSPSDYYRSDLASELAIGLYEKGA